MLVDVDELRQLISAADDCNVSFVYALSPGLDIVYTSSSDVSALKAKLDQVATVNCVCDVSLINVCISSSHINLLR